MREQIPNYVLIDKIGEGGMSVVYRARQIETGLTVAVKLLKEERHQEPPARGLFLREAILLSTLRHPNVSRLLDSGETNRGRFFFVTELYRGNTLQQLLIRDSLTVERAIDIAIQVARGLGAAHAQQIVHRDIKPANLVVASGKPVKILDFGLAHFQPAVELGRSVGTPSYTAPEQYRGEPTDARADIWSLGVVLYETVTGKVPFPGADRREVAAAVQSRVPLPLAEHHSDLPAGLQSILDRALAKNPDDRYPAAADFEADLAMLLTDSPPSPIAY